MFAGLGTAGRRTQGVYGYARSCSRHWTPKCHLSGHQPTPHVHEDLGKLKQTQVSITKMAKFRSTRLRRIGHLRTPADTYGQKKTIQSGAGVCPNRSEVKKWRNGIPNRRIAPNKKAKAFPHNHCLGSPYCLMEAARHVSKRAKAYRYALKKRTKPLQTLAWHALARLARFKSPVAGGRSRRRQGLKAEG